MLGALPRLEALPALLYKFAKLAGEPGDGDLPIRRAPVGQPAGRANSSAKQFRVGTALVPPISSSYRGCSKLVKELEIESGTRIIELLVPLCFRSSCQRVPPCITNFGSGALAGMSRIAAGLEL